MEIILITSEDVKAGSHLVYDYGYAQNEYDAYLYEMIDLNSLDYHEGMDRQPYVENCDSDSDTENEDESEDEDEFEDQADEEELIEETK